MSASGGFQVQEIFRALEKIGAVTHPWAPTFDIYFPACMVHISEKEIYKQDTLQQVADLFDSRLRALKQELCEHIDTLSANLRRELTLPLPPEAPE